MKSAWTKFWPQTGNVPNWDAVGHLESDSGLEYVLVEAKAHVEELMSDCGASKKGGLEMIRNALATTIEDNDLSPSSVDDWLSPYYQYANRLAHLHFLLQHGVLAHLVFIYFYGDQWRTNLPGKKKLPICPKNAQEWETHLKNVRVRLGLNGESALELRTHNVFLQV